MANRENIMQGQKDIPLSELGKKQAQMVAHRLQNEKFTKMYSSDLSRAADTAKAIAAANVSCCGLILDKRLRERGFGVLENKPLAEYRKQLETAHVPAALFTPQGGETMEQVDARATEFFSEMCKEIAEPLMNIGTSSSSCQCQSGGVQGSCSQWGCSKSGSSQKILSGPPSPTCDSRNHSGQCGPTQDNGPADVSKPLHVDIGGRSGYSPPRSRMSPCSLSLSHRDSDHSNSQKRMSTCSLNSARRYTGHSHHQSNMPPRCCPSAGALTCLNPPVADISPPPCRSLPDVFQQPIFASDCSRRHGSSVDVESPSILIVSHGLLLRSLKRLILSCYSKRLEGNLALEAGRISPNTGVSQFTMSVCWTNSGVTTRCMEIIIMNDTCHLSGSDDLVTHAKFQGAF